MTVFSKNGSVSKVKGYRLVAKKVKERIISNEWRAGNKLPSERDLEKEFNFSRLTISKGLAELVAEGLLTRRQGQGTFVAENPHRQVVNGRLLKYISPRDSPSVNIVVKHGVLQAMCETFTDEGYHVGVDFYQTPEELKELLRKEADIYHGGFIVWYEPNEGVLPEMKKVVDSNYPIVLIDSYQPEFDIDYVVADNISNAVSVVEYLYSLGHFDIAYVTKKLDRTSLCDRRTGFIKGLLDFGLPVKNERILSLDDNRAGEDDLHSLLSSLMMGADAPSAIFFSHDDLALKAMDHFKSEGVRVPEDVSIVGYDGIDRGEYAPVPLTTMSQNFFRIGEEASKILLDRLYGRIGKRPVQMFIKSELTIRSSCAGISNK